MAPYSRKVSPYTRVVPSGSKCVHFTAELFGQPQNTHVCSARFCGSIGLSFQSADTTRFNVMCAK
jgi:hypothetical protein